MEEKEKKSELVKEICFISSAFASCEHISSHARNRVFIDWYLILKVKLFFFFLNYFSSM